MQKQDADGMEASFVGKPITAEIRFKGGGGSDSPAPYVQAEALATQHAAHKKKVLTSPVVRPCEVFTFLNKFPHYFFCYKH